MRHEKRYREGNELKWSRMELASQIVLRSSDAIFTCEDCEDTHVEDALVEDDLIRRKKTKI